MFELETTTTYTLNQEHGTELRKQFTEDCYVALPSFLSDNSFLALASEVQRIMRSHSTRKDIGTKDGETIARHFSVVSGVDIATYSTIIPSIYKEPYLLDFLSGIAGTRLLESPDPFDRYVVHHACQPGDRHGGHIDTYPYAFTILIDAPPFELGGALEYVPYSTQAFDLRTQKKRYANHAAGDAYLLRADKTVHGVSSLARNADRISLVFSYADEETAHIPMAFGSNLLYA